MAFVREKVQTGNTPVNNPENAQAEKRTYPLAPKQFFLISRIQKIKIEIKLDRDVSVKNNLNFEYSYTTSSKSNMVNFEKIKLHSTKNGI